MDDDYRELANRLFATATAMLEDTTEAAVGGQSTRIAQSKLVNQGDVSRILPLGLLAPDIVEAILGGRQPIELTAKRLKRIRDLPVSWAEQRRVLGFA